LRISVMMESMVFKKLLSSLGFGGVEVDTVLAAQPAGPGGTLSGQVHLRAKGDVDIAAIQLLIVASGAMGEVELGRFTVAGGLRLGSGAAQAVAFTITLPAHTPITILYGQNLPGVSVGVRTEVAVAGGTGKTDFDPLQVQATEVHQHIIDALGTIGCRFVRNELRPAGQAITFYAPVPAGQPVGPHIPQLTFVFAADPQGMNVTAELVARPGQGDPHRITPELASRLSAATDGSQGWVEHVDGWVTQILAKAAATAGAGSGSFMQPAPAAMPGYAPQGRQQPYAYSGAAPAYQYGGYRGGGLGIGSVIAGGVGGAALGFLGGMMLADMMQPDVTVNETVNNYETGTDDQSYQDSSYGDSASYQDAGYDDYSGGYDDYGGGDFGGGDFGGGDF
jgi:sporulation-control protein